MSIKLILYKIYLEVILHEKNPNMNPNIYDKHHITCWKGCSAATLSRSMQSLILATVLCITFSSARHVPEEEAVEITARRAPSWTAKVSHKHMCSWCNGINEALAFSQQVCICKICWYVDIIFDLLEKPMVRWSRVCYHWEKHCFWWRFKPNFLARKLGWNIEWRHQGGNLRVQEY